MTLSTVQNKSSGSFLAVLKNFGLGNGQLSFPKEGLTLALDFKASEKTLIMLDKLDKVVNKYGGRVYLTKDARLSRKNFQNTYPLVENFIKLRKEYNFDKKFNSSQSKRLGI